MLLPVVAAYIIFAYFPMGGLVIAFQNFAPRLGIAGSKWVGLKYFQNSGASLSRDMKWR